VETTGLETDNFSKWKRVGGGQSATIPVAFISTTKRGEGNGEDSDGGDGTASGAQEAIGRG
jgi:hypothetical protein